MIPRSSCRCTHAPGLRRRGLIWIGDVRVIAPVGYLDMMALLDACNRVLTIRGLRRKPIFSASLA